MAQQTQILLTSPSELSKELEIFAKSVSDDDKDKQDLVSIDDELQIKYKQMEMEMKYKDEFIESNLNQIASLNKKIRNVQTQNGDIQKILNISSSFTGVAVGKYAAKMHEKNEIIKDLQAKLITSKQSEQARNEKIVLLENKNNELMAQIAEFRANSNEYEKMTKDYNKKQLELKQVCDEHLNKSKKRYKECKKQCALLTKNNENLIKHIEASNVSFEWRQNAMANEIKSLKLEKNEKDETINDMRQKYVLFEKEFVFKHKSNMDRIRCLNKEAKEMKERLIEYALLKKKFKEMNAENKELKESAMRTKGVMWNLSDKHTKLEKEFAVVRQDNHGKDQTIKYLNGKIKGLKAESFALLTTSKELKRKITANNAVISGLRKKNLANKKVIKQFDERKRESMQSENAYIVKHEANVLKIKALNEEIKELKQSIDKNEIKISQQTYQNEELKEQNQANVESINGLNEQISKMKMESMEKDDLMKSDKNKIKILMEERAALQLKYDEFVFENEMKVNAAKRVNEEMEAALKQSEEKLSDIMEEINAAFEEKRNLQRQISGMQLENQQKEDALQMSVKQRDDWQQKYEEQQDVNTRLKAKAAEEIDKLLNRINKMSLDLRQKEDEIDGFHAEYNEIVAEKDAVLKEICRKETEQTKLLSTMEKMKHNIEKKDEIITKMSKEMKQMNQRFDANEGAHNEEVAALNEEIKKLCERISQNKEGHNDEIAALDHEIQKMNEQRDAMSVQIDELMQTENKYKALNKTFYVLKSENATLRKEIEELKLANNEIHDYKAEICLLRSKILDERENSDRLKYEMNKITEFIESNKKDFERLNEKMNQEMDENEALNTKCIAIKQQYEEIQQISLKFEQMNERMSEEYAQNMNEMNNKYEALKRENETFQFENAKILNQKEHICKLDIALKKKTKAMTQMKMEFVATNDSNLDIIKRLNEKNKKYKAQMLSTYNVFGSERISNEEKIQKLEQKVCDLNVTNKENDYLRTQHDALQKEHRLLAQRLVQFVDGCKELEIECNRNMDEQQKKYVEKMNGLQTKINEIQSKLVKLETKSKGVENGNDFMNDLRVNLIKIEKEFMMLSPKNKGISLREQMTNNRGYAYKEALEQCVSQQNNCKKLLGQSEESDIFSFKCDIPKFL